MHDFSLYQLLVPTFATLMVLRAVSHMSRKQLTIREFFTILVFWVFVSLVSVFPKIFIDEIALFLGIRSGINAIFFFGFIVLFYAVFKLIVAVEESQEKLTMLVRTIALKDLDDEK